MPQNPPKLLAGVGPSAFGLLNGFIARRQVIIAGSFKSQLIGYFDGAITSWELVEGSLWQFYDNET